MNDKTEERLTTMLGYLVCELDALENGESLLQYKATYSDFKQTYESATWTTVRKLVKYRPLFRNYTMEKQHLNNCINRTERAIKELSKCQTIRSQFHAG